MPSKWKKNNRKRTGVESPSSLLSSFLSSSLPPRDLFPRGANPGEERTLSFVRPTLVL